MGNTFKSLDALMGSIKKKIDNALGNEVAEIVKETEQQSAIYEVYAAYEPKMYERRGGDDGLGDMENMVSTVSGGVLTVTNETEFDNRCNSLHSGNNLDELIEYGHGAGGLRYTYGDEYPYDYIKPRPFIQKTKETLALSGGAIIKAALEIGLERQGIDVK